jgi:hypothetical protein
VVTFEGTAHTVGNLVEDSSGVVHFKGHINIQAQGVSPSGAKYVFTALRNEEVTFDLESTSIVTLHTTIIRQGEDGTEEDFNAQIVARLTLNANGELTTEFLTFRIECQ